MRDRLYEVMDTGGHRWPQDGKRAPRNARPYRVTARIGSRAHSLDMPAGSRMNTTFHVDLLKKFYSDAATRPLQILWSRHAGWRANAHGGFLLESILLESILWAHVEAMHSRHACSHVAHAPLLFGTCAAWVLGVSNEVEWSMATQGA